MKIKIASVILMTIGYCLAVEAQEKTNEPDDRQIIIQMLHDFDGLPHGIFSGTDLKLPIPMPKYSQIGDITFDEGDPVMVVAGHVEDRLSHGHLLRVLKVFDTDRNSVGMVGSEEKSQPLF